MNSLPPQEIIDGLMARKAQDSMVLSARSPVNAKDLVEFIPRTADLNLWLSTAAHLAMFDWLDAVEKIFDSQESGSRKLQATYIVPSNQIFREKYGGQLLSFPGIDIYQNLSTDSLRLTRDFMPDIAQKMQDWYPLMGPAFEFEFEQVAKKLAKSFPDGFLKNDLTQVRKIALGDWMSILEKTAMEHVFPDVQGKFDLRAKRI